jgi:hypothetical protein
MNITTTNTTTTTTTKNYSNKKGKPLYFEPTSSNLTAALPLEILNHIFSFVPNLSPMLLINKQWKAATEGQLDCRYPKEMRTSIEYVKALAECHCFNGAKRMIQTNNLSTATNLFEVEMFGFALEIMSFPLLFRTFNNLSFDKPKSKHYAQDEAELYRHVEKKHLKTNEYRVTIKNKIDILYSNFISHLECNLNSMDFCIEKKFIRFGSPYFGLAGSAYYDHFLKTIFEPLFLKACENKDHEVAIKMLMIIKEYEMKNPEFHWKKYVSDLADTGCDYRLFSNLVPLYPRTSFIRDADFIPHTDFNCNSLIYYSNKLLSKNDTTLQKVVQLFCIVDKLLKFGKEKESISLENGVFERLLTLVPDSELICLEFLSHKRFDRLIDTLIKKRRWEDAKLVSSVLVENSHERAAEYLEKIDTSQVIDLSAEEEDDKKIASQVEARKAYLAGLVDDDTLIYDSGEEYNSSDYDESESEIADLDDGEISD